MGVLSATADDAEVVCQWPNTERTVARTRQALIAALDAWGMHAVQDDARLVLSELVSNAVRHAQIPAGRVIETRFCRLADGRVRIEVHDANDGRPRLRSASKTDESGRGLALVDALAEQWGVSGRSGPGKSVWAVVSSTDF